ncbi:hypothetical protein HV213_16720 [Klebsiella sp. RHBSTW-00484]|uniref:hypothetical protein n=1 Tax=unclassified Klebsiella TaxID=2608929 RepID=UPI0015E49C3C|nr:MULTISPECIES: hypothetical protein [unclassified Klebsiella]QLO37340.1 hypothetical protein HV213_16720 [Klebsiella sp. RHBSTW-00484]QLT76858.1 hypothetical protein HV204_16720 [Klebsiella sp. RHBSTW-00464]
MTRETTIFNIRYSFYIETMQATFFNRMDRMLTFIQIMLGSAIFAAYGSIPLFGAVVAAISVISFVWQPGRVSMLCEVQSRKMKQLINLPASYSDEELHVAYLRAEEGDNPTLGLFRDAAHKRTLISFGRYSEAKAIRLSPVEKIMSWLAGDLPKDD